MRRYHQRTIHYFGASSVDFLQKAVRTLAEDLDSRVKGPKGSYACRANWEALHCKVIEPRGLDAR